MHPTFSHERRGFPRGYVAAVATVFVQHVRIGEYSVRDLSAGGASLVDGPPLTSATKCTLQMRMPGLGKLRLSGVIAYVSDKVGEGLGVRFTNLQPEVEDGLRELVQQELERATLPSVLVADLDLERLANTAEGLATLGERPVLARTAVDVIAWLSDPGTTIELALIAGPQRTKSGEDLLDFIRDEFPNIRSVAIEPPLDEVGLEQLLEHTGSPARQSVRLPLARTSSTSH